MKIKIVFILSMLLVVGIGKTIAQSYTPPSREMVENYLDQIDSCKAFLKELEADIAEMENNPELVTLAQYKEAKALQSRAESCLRSTRAKLEELRKKFPGWFNSPSATLNLSKGGHITPKGLRAGLDAIEAKIDKLLNRLNAIEEPAN
ncbi:MAG: hypothetical protein DWP94_15015 [Flavobacterium sp.]|nr:MAG: hypothetical protein DWP94_15015 [Flavobacterium sp.]